ncbi:TRAP transporter large permease [Cytobacillus firmus]|uniref:TRAP transporter large permease n=1 Tax=Cytobacillus firmus TaxID=1399 RepID=A0AA46Q1J8_CYTFI|nr:MULTISPECIES: TRAP transporter large permease [Bacillaceae]MBG9444614.1 C4-dicarboxylate ABC transporter permease [Cytobacillus firmus]MBY6052189.1 TRAP transporter large permease [Cytobacillus firmus]USK38591.1 TRAP transporter large permease [Cytobacillus firmus]UYG93899.1 TRAP transporter large permease [Cytobacillus firmus]WHY33762.1 TRAP transporter large permease [Cytobacillus firmus]
MAGVLFGSFAAFLFLTVPIGIAIGLAVLFTILYTGSMPVEFLMKELTNSVDSFPLLAVPYFIIAGEIMGKGGISKRLFNVADSMVGNKTGGIAMATIITCMFFAAISGSGPATVAAIGGIMIPAMVQKGYDKRFATAVVAAAGSIGVIIPPSIPMVIYGVSGSVSIGDMFIAGIIPGILVGIGLMVYSYIHSKKMGYTGSNQETTLKGILTALWQAKWALMIPVVILGGIYGGIFTPTEAAVVAVVFGLIVSVFVYKELKLKDLPQIFVDSALTTASVLVIVGAATAFGRLLTLEQIPNQIAEAMISISSEPLIIMMLITLLLLIVGCFMDTIAAIIILTPILLPVALQIGYDPIHFGIIMIVNLAIGFITPPLGVNLFVGAGISGLSLEQLSKAIVPFFFAMVFTLLIIIVIPQISLLFL